VSLVSPCNAWVLLVPERAGTDGLRGRDAVNTRRALGMTFICLERGSFVFADFGGMLLLTECAYIRWVSRLILRHILLSVAGRTTRVLLTIGQMSGRTA